MVVEPRKKRTLLYTVAGVTLVEACFGLAVLITIHVTSESTFTSTSTSTVLPTNVSNHSITVSSTETTSSLPVVSTPPNNSSNDSTNDSTRTDKFKDFIQLIRNKTESSIGIGGYTAWFSIYTALDIIWIFAVLNIFVAAHNIPNNYKHLLHYIFVTAIICVTDVATTIYFSIFLLKGDNVDSILSQVQDLEDFWESFAAAVALMFVPIYCSKIGIYWIINIIFLVKMLTCYKLFKEKYDNPFGKEIDSSYDLKDYDSEDDNSTGYENTGYTENLDKSNWSFQPPTQNGDAAREPQLTHTARRENSISSSRSSNSNITSLPPPKVIGMYTKVSINDHSNKRIENGYAPSKASLANRRATGYYANNELPIRNTIANRLEAANNALEAADNDETPAITFPASMYNKLPDDKISIPRVRLVQ